MSDPTKSPLTSYTTEQINFPAGSRGDFPHTVHSFKWADGAETRCGRDTAAAVCYECDEYDTLGECRHTRRLARSVSAF